MKQRKFQMIKTNGVTLRTVVEGKGPLIVLLHGFPQCWYLWRHQIDPVVAAGERRSESKREKQAEKRHAGVVEFRWLSAPLAS